MNFEITLEKIKENVLNSYYVDHQHGSELFDIDLTDLLNHNEDLIEELEQQVEEANDEINILETEVSDLQTRIDELESE